MHIQMKTQLETMRMYVMGPPSSLIKLFWVNEKNNKVTLAFIWPNKLWNAIKFVPSESVYFFIFSYICFVGLIVIWTSIKFESHLLKGYHIVAFFKKVLCVIWFLSLSIIKKVSQIIREMSNKNYTFFSNKRFFCVFVISCFKVISRSFFVHKNNCSSRPEVHCGLPEPYR